MLQYLPRAAVVLGAALLVFGLSDFAGDGYGEALNSFGWSNEARLVMTGGAALLAWGWVASRRA